MLKAGDKDNPAIDNPVNFKNFLLSNVTPHSGEHRAWNGEFAKPEGFGYPFFYFHPCSAFCAMRFTLCNSSLLTPCYFLTPAP